MVKILKYWLEAIVCLLLTILVLATFSQVIFRFVFTLSAPWLQEVIRISFSYMVFLSAGLGVKYSSHLSVEVLENLPAKFKNPIVGFGKLLMLVFIVIFIYYGYLHTINSKDQYTSTLEISNMYLHLVLPISGIIMLYYHLKNMIVSYRDLKKGEANQ